MVRTVLRRTSAYSAGRVLAVSPAAGTLKDGIGDYDCSAGSGNGPNYVRGPVRVLPPDPFGLDGNGDGVGCEKG